MTDKFAVGDRVRILMDEGYDLPHEVQGKVGVVAALVGDSEYDVVTTAGLVAQAAYYHLELSEPCEVLQAPEDVPGEPYAWQGHTPPQIVILDKNVGQVGGYAAHYAVAIGCLMEDCYKFVEQKYPSMTKDRQIIELEDINEWGGNDQVCVNYIAYDAPGFTTAYAMWGLADAGYDIRRMMDLYIAP